MRFLFFMFMVMLTLPAAAQTAVDGYKAYDAGDYEKAKSIMFSLAQEGDPVAMNAMGVFYIDGKAFPKDRIKGCNWYEKAALENYLPAQYNFAICFGVKGGRKRNIKLHLQWFTKAAEKSYLKAQLQLMFWYMKTNKKLAKKWGEKAAAQNSTVARVALWMTNMDDNISPVKISEIACVFYNVRLLKRGWSACDD